MFYRYNKRFNKEISEIGFGAWQLGDKGTWAYMTNEDGVKLVEEALIRGVNLFDTAPNYANGNSEIVLGEALKNVREKVFINTKVGHGPNNTWEFTKDGIRNSVQRSLKKLQTDYLDSVILHNPEHYILEGNNELIDELISLKEEGLIKGFGYSIDTLEELNTVLNNGIDFDVIEIMFNIIHQEPRYLFDEVKKRDILLITKVPLDSGWLTGKYSKDSIFKDIRTRWTKEDINLRASIIDDIKEILQEDNLVSSALRYILHYDVVGSVIPGTKNLKQLYSNVDASNGRLSQETIDKLEEYYDTKLKEINLPW